MNVHQEIRSIKRKAWTAIAETEQYSLLIQRWSLALTNGNAEVVQACGEEYETLLAQYDVAWKSALAEFQKAYLERQPALFEVVQ